MMMTEAKPVSEIMKGLKDGEVYKPRPSDSRLFCEEHGHGCFDDLGYGVIRTDHPEKLQWERIPQNAEEWAEYVSASEYDDPAVRAEVEAMFDTSPRAELLDEAKALITGDRNNQYGEPTQDFSRTAELWTAEFSDMLQEGVAFQPHHVALAMMLLKISRLAWSPGKKDSWVDIAGYAGCGHECAEKGL